MTPKHLFSKYRAIFVKLTALTLLAYALLATPTSSIAQPIRNPYDSGPTISVTGEAVIMVRPDRIKISLGIETKDQNITSAKTRNLAIAKATIAALEKLGIPEKEIQTDHLSIQPNYRNDNPENELIGYIARNNLIITLRDPAKVEEIVTVALESGVNYVHGIDFQTADLKKYRDQARDLALKAAREKAIAMANTLGQAIGQPRNIMENPTSSFYLSSWSDFRHRGFAGMAQVEIRDLSDPSDPTAVVLGQLTVRANVDVTFELIPQDQAATTSAPRSPTEG